MDALVMCGGQGTRLDAPVEKPLLEVAGSPMVDRVCDALSDGPVDAVSAAVSPHTPATRTHLGDRVDVRVVETPGEGYVADLDAALSSAALARPVLTSVADLPLLTPAHVERVRDAYRRRDGDSLTVAVPAARKRERGVSVDTTFDRDGRELAPTGLNVVGDGDGDGDGESAVLVVADDQLAVNVNRPRDRAVAERASRSR